jgi:hypothetical protein
MIDDSPIFITGTWRCGSTLASRILNAHPDISLIYDGLHILNYISEEEIYKKKLINISSKKIKINSIIKNRFNKSIELKISSVRKFYRSVLTQLSIDKSKKIFGEKSNVQWRSIEKFLKIFPKGRVLHIVRDPRAVLASWKYFTYSKGDKYIDSIFNSYDSMKHAEIYKKKFYNKRYCVVRYEDLVINPKKTLKSIMKKFELRFNYKMLDFKNYQDNIGNKWLSNSSYNTELQNKIYKKNINEWKNKLNENEIYLCETLLEKTMINFDYKLNFVQQKNKNNDTFIKYCKKIFKNSFLSEALMQYIFNKIGQERFPVKNK